MFRKYLSFILFTLIAFQSVSAIADVHQIHQEQTQHLKFDHELEKNLTGVDKSADSSIPTQPDCHHCCHCHSASPLSVGDASNILLTKPKQALSEYQFEYFSYLKSPDIRPPIS